MSDSKHILVVDDEEALCLVFRKRFKNEGFRVSVASRVDEALRLNADDPVDLIVSDIKMPGGTGFDLLTLTKLIDSQVPIILMSGFEEIESMVEKSVDEGVFACLKKPFKFEDLLKLTNQALSTKH